jgi:cytochrome c oxidase subunit 2
MVVLLFGGVIASLVSGTAPSLDEHHHVKYVDPANLAMTPFAKPGLREATDGSLEAWIVARAFTFEPRELRVPLGEPVTLHFTSPDVTHGVKIEATNVNVQIIPGSVASVTHTFTRPGRFLVGCNEYCGAGHHAMNTLLIVEPRKETR